MAAEIFQDQSSCLPMQTSCPPMKRKFTGFQSLRGNHASQKAYNRMQATGCQCLTQTPIFVLFLIQILELCDRLLANNCTLVCLVLQEKWVKINLVHLLLGSDLEFLFPVTTTSIRNQVFPRRVFSFSLLLCLSNQ